MRWLTAVVCACVWWLSAGEAARADFFLEAPHAGDGRDEMVVAARKAAEQKLAELGFALKAAVPPADGRRCTMDCALSQITKAGAKGVLKVQVWASIAGQLPEVYVFLADHEGRVDGGQALEKDDPADAARVAALAVAEAWGKWPQRFGGVLNVRGPAGASLLVDNDRQRGQLDLPASIPLEAGPHAVLASLADHKTRRYEVQIESGKATDLVVELEPEKVVSPSVAARRAAPAADVDAGSVSPSPPRPSRLRWVGPSVMGAVGVAGVVLGVVGNVRSTCEREFSDGTCASRWGVGRATKAYLGTGALLLTASAAWFAISARRGRTETQIAVGPGGLGVRVKL